MKETCRIAKCPACQVSVPLDVDGNWIEHWDGRFRASWICVGSGKKPHEEKVETVCVSDEPEA